MRVPDPHKEKSERELSLSDFLKFYNETLPSGFPPASTPLLKKFQKTYPSLFKDNDTWSLGQHRKKFMDWLPQHLRTSSQ